jgi:uncharacterized protein (TIGR02271 family)
MDRDDREQVPLREEDEIIIPVIEEEVVADAQPVKTGAVRVEKHVETRIRRIDTPLLREQVEVRHVPVNRVVTEAPPVRRKGDTVIVPVVEEELVVTKRLVLKEEIHLIKKRSKERFVKDVEVERERAEVRRIDPEGRIVDANRQSPVVRPNRKRTLLD